MYEHEPPLFVFTSDGDVDAFTAIADAESYYEPWLSDDFVPHVYDARGVVFTAEKTFPYTFRVAEPLRQDYDALVARLRDYAIRCATELPDFVDLHWAQTAPADEMVEWSAATFRRPGRGRPAGEEIASFLQWLLRLKPPRRIDR